MRPERLVRAAAAMACVATGASAQNVLGYNPIGLFEEIPAASPAFGGVGPGELCNIPAGTPFAASLFSLAPAAAGPVWLAAPITALPVAFAGASATLGLPLGGVPAGTAFYQQWLIVAPCTGALAFSNAIQVEVAR